MSNKTKENQTENNDKRTSKKTSDSNEKSYDIKIKKTITLTAYITQKASNREEAYEMASVSLEKELTQTLNNSEKNKSTYNFLIEDYEDDRILDQED